MLPHRQRRHRHTTFTSMTTRAGHIAIVGKPNAGKSTLLNRLIGTRLAITSPKPQSTRQNAVGIVTTADAQLVLLDTPGLLDPAYALQRSMLASAVSALRGADVVVHVHDATTGPTPQLDTLLPAGTPLPAHRVVFANKSDLLTDGNRDPFRSDAHTVLGSAEHGDGIDTLIARVGSLLPESPFLYPDDDLSTQPVRFFAAEAVREAALHVLHEEVPYGIFVAIEEFQESKTPVLVRAVIYVERDSQKGIVLGAKGRTIREIGTIARGRIEHIIERGVYLDLWVKVMPDWRKDEAALRRFGFELPVEGR
jgi:GTPase